MSRGLSAGRDAASSAAAGAGSAMMSSLPLNWNVFVSRWGWGHFLHRRIEGQGAVQFQADLASGGQIRVVTLLEDLAEHGNRHDGAGADGRARADARQI